MTKENLKTVIWKNAIGVDFRTEYGSNIYYTQYEERLVFDESNNKVLSIKDGNIRHKWSADEILRVIS